MALSPAQVAIDGLLRERKGISLSDYIEIRRTAGKSWRAIAGDLRDETTVDVTEKTIQRWAVDLGLTQEPQEPVEVAS